MCYFHGNLFDGVRSHAGKHRRTDYGTDVLWFGPNPSTHRSKVVDELDRIFAELQKSVATFEANPSAPDYEESALRLAAWVHAELIRIHPFEDGNGRSCRLLMNNVLLRLGLLPIALEVPKQEYHNCLNFYFATGDIRPLEALCLRVYPLA